MLQQRRRPPDPARVFSGITDIAITLMLIARLFAGFFIFRVAGITLDALLVNQPDGPEPFQTRTAPANNAR
ncbi:hypothetical protein AN684_0211595 [Klebsiella pneumoniae subsp. pneumoniae]|nr:hypothetical protein AN657_0225615 [Klebsiella pneumoniae subsp. pneumoniae]OCN39003.1 hypothetical protein AN656_0225495 [Klebsiella pneumoniae subsp. pneumoniae]OCN69711.1 hypothetical protein AN675_0201790 [Klebsiella pneumoniae subsp. pneumoniae]OCN84588.1 hypothetical protein AN680_0224825 [Klebsiella pneumoniae subsp. pneumoniae]OCN91561.1 hypothetical protein AN677_0200850 [Klebsiella pneumoniae subsp. pneumoniae]